MNHITLIGRIGKDAETRTAGGVDILSFTLATSEKYTDKEGQRRENTEWHTCKMFNRAALAPHLTKGTLIAVEGRMHYDSYEGQNGEKRYSAQVICDRLEFLSAKGEGTNAPAPSAPRATAAPKAAPSLNPTEGDDGSDFPF